MKKKKTFIIIGIIFIVILIFVSFYFIYIKKDLNVNNLFIGDTTIKEGLIEVVVKDTKPFFCLIKDEDSSPSVSDESWVESNSNCSFEIKQGAFFIFIKDSTGDIRKVEGTDTLSITTDIEVKETVYLAPSDSEKIEINTIFYGIDKGIELELSNDSVEASIDGNVISINAKKIGSSIIKIKQNDKEVQVKVIVSNLIKVKPANYVLNQTLSCKIYNNEEAKLLEAILEDRVNTAGYKTRAGVLAAVHFLTLEFPYRITYFGENGRMAPDRSFKVDGEGRFYHKGLYLHDDKTSVITDPYKGPAIWGCPMYSVPNDFITANGLDCSGFVSWALLNGGFDVKDVGSGLAEHLDLTDYGDKVRLNKDLLSQDKIKAGDLIGYDGHIAIIAGIENGKYHVAESLWFLPNYGVQIRIYDEAWLLNKFSYVMLMDSYYTEDGNYSKMWN